MQHMLGEPRSPIELWKKREESCCFPKPYSLLCNDIVSSMDTLSFVFKVNAPKLLIRFVGKRQSPR